ncbi:MAG: hypothetical protein WBK91_01030 [Alphaproteobacteria bacterium]
MAKFCGLLPLVVGSGLFVAWAALRHDWMLYAGLLLIPVFLLLIVFGFVTLGLHVRQCRQALTPYVRRSLFAAALLFSNIPVGIALTCFVLDLREIYIVHLQNNSTRSAADIIMTDPLGAEFPVDPLPPAAHAEHRLRFAGEGQVAFRLSLDGVTKTGTLFGYITSGMGGQAFLTIETDGHIVISEK